MTVCLIARRVDSTATTVMYYVGCGMKTTKEHENDQLVNLDALQNVRIGVADNQLCEINLSLYEKSERNDLKKKVHLLIFKPLDLFHADHHQCLTWCKERKNVLFNDESRFYLNKDDDTEG